MKVEEAQWPEVDCPIPGVTTGKALGGICSSGMASVRLDALVHFAGSLLVRLLWGD